LTAFFEKSLGYWTSFAPDIVLCDTKIKRS